MREKTERFVITFHTTSEAIAMEKGCQQQGISGRLIPVPRQISAGCGLAWVADLQEMERLETFILENQLGFELKGIYFV